MFSSLITVLFGCSHRRTSFPLSPKAGTLPAVGPTYVTCLDCGTEFEYDWVGMRLGKAPLSRPKAAFSDQLEDSRLVVTRPLSRTADSR